MIRLILLFAAAAAIAIGAAFIAGQPGSVSVQWAGGEARMSLGVAIGLLLLAVAVLLAVWRVVSLIAGGPGAFRRWGRERRRRSGYLALAKAMVAVAAGDAKEARKHQAKANRLYDEKLLLQLLEAQRAQLEADDAGAARAYADMLGAPETEFLGLRGLFIQALRRNDAASALRYSRQAFALRPQTPWVSAALFDLNAQARDWSAAAAALEAQGRAKLLGPDVQRRRKAILLTEEARDLEAAGQLEDSGARAREALNLAPGLLPASLISARAYVKADKPKRAAAVLERAWALDPHPEIAAAFAGIYASQPGRKFERLIALNPEHAESRLLSAAQAAALRRWDDAEAQLKPLLRPRPAARAARLMEEIARGRGDAQAAAHWADQGLRAPRDGVWRCRACGHESLGWSSSCPSCRAFDMSVWTPPLAAHETRLGDDDAGRVLYRMTPEPEAEPPPVPVFRPVSPVTVLAPGAALTHLRPDDPGPDRNRATPFPWPD